MGSKCRTPRHKASHKGLALGWHGDSSDNDHNGEGASAGQVTNRPFPAALCCIKLGGGSESVTLQG